MDEKIEYTKEIKKLREKSDSNAGVKVHNDNGTVIRDVRNMISSSSPRLQENYLIQALNVLCAGKTLIEISKDGENAKLAELKDQIDGVAKIIIKEHTSQSERYSEEKCFRILQEANYKVLSILKQAGINTEFEQNEEELLNVAKNYSSFETDHPDIITILPIKDKDGNHYVQYSKKLCALTDEQKQQYENLSEQKWFNILPKYKQKLVEKYKDKITGGFHLIPTQIRDIPGLRNGYTTTIGKCKESIKNIDDIDYLYKFTHSGTIAAFSKDDQENKEMASGNLDQLRQSLIGGLHLIILNTNKSVSPGDIECVTDTNGAVKQHNDTVIEHSTDAHQPTKESQSIIVKQDNPQIKAQVESGERIMLSNTPTNIFRIFAKGDYTSITKFLDDVSSSIKMDNGKLKTVKEYLQASSGGDFDKAKNEVGEIENDPEFKLQNFLFYALNLKQLINRQTSSLAVIHTLFAGRDSPQLQVNRKFIELQYRLEQLTKNNEINSLSLESIKQQRIHVACKSGKDRTGFVGLAVALDVIKSNIPEKSESEIAEALATAGHVQFLAGISGGTLGCVGLKPLIFSIPKKLGEVLEKQLILSTAKFNGSIHKPSNFSHHIVIEDNGTLLYKLLKLLLYKLLKFLYWVESEISSVLNRGNYNLVKGVGEDKTEHSVESGVTLTHFNHLNLTTENLVQSKNSTSEDKEEYDSGYDSDNKSFREKVKVKRVDQRKERVENLVQSKNSTSEDKEEYDSGYDSDNKSFREKVKVRRVDQRKERVENLVQSKNSTSEDKEEYDSGYDSDNKSFREKVKRRKGGKESSEIRMYSNV